MSSHRNLRVAQAIREVVSSAILFEAADPRIRAVTVLGVEVTGDLRNATIAVSIMGTELEQDRAMQGLKHAAGFFQSRVANRLQTRFTPILSFKRDDSVKKSIEMSRLIDEALAAERPGPEPEPVSRRDEPSADDDDDDDDDDVEEEDGDSPSGDRP